LARKSVHHALFPFFLSIFVAQKVHSGGPNVYENESKGKIRFYGITFEQWEEIYSKSWFLLRYVFSGLKDIMELFYVPLTKETLSGGVPVLVPDCKQKWHQTYVYYFERGNRWIFYKQNKE